MSENYKISSRTRASAPKLIDALTGQVNELEEENKDLKEKLSKEQEKTKKQEIQLKRGNSFMINPLDKPNTKTQNIFCCVNEIYFKQES